MNCCCSSSTSNVNEIFTLCLKHNAECGTAGQLHSRWMQTLFCFGVFMVSFLYGHVLDIDGYVDEFEDELVVFVESTVDKFNAVLKLH